MVVAIRMKRMGRKNRPFYRVYASDSRSPRDGRTIEPLGFYDPLAPKAENQLKLDAERVKYWVSVGAQPSEVMWTLIARGGIDIPRKVKVKRERKKKAHKWVPPKKRVPRPKKKKKPEGEGEAAKA